MAMAAKIASASIAFESRGYRRRLSPAPSVSPTVTGSVEMFAFVNVSETTSPLVNVEPPIEAVNVAVSAPPVATSAPPMGASVTVSFPVPVCVPEIVVA